MSDKRAQLDTDAGEVETRGGVSQPGGRLRTFLEKNVATNTKTFVEDCPLYRLKANPNNPRRKSLDSLGLSAELVAELGKQPGETLTQWQDRLEVFGQRFADDTLAAWRSLTDLAGSIAVVGVIQPVVTNPKGLIIAGERRSIAAQLAGLTGVPVSRRDVDAEQIAGIAFAENDNREDLAPLETIYAVRQMAAGLASSKGKMGQRVAIRDMIALTGAGRTRAAAYAAFANLPEGDSLLAMFDKTPPISIKDAYRLTSQRLRELNYEQDVLVAEQMGEAPPEPPKPQKPTKTRVHNVPVVLRPGIKGFFMALADGQPLPPAARDEARAFAHDWAQLSDKEVRQRLGKLLDLMAEGFETQGETADG